MCTKTFSYHSWYLSGYLKSLFYWTLRKFLLDLYVHKLFVLQKERENIISSEIVIVGFQYTWLTNTWNS